MTPVTYHPFCFTCGTTDRIAQCGNCLIHTYCARHATQDHFCETRVIGRTVNHFKLLPLLQDKQPARNSADITYVDSKRLWNISWTDKRPLPKHGIPREGICLEFIRVQNGETSGVVIAKTEEVPMEEDAVPPFSLTDACVACRLPDAGTCTSCDLPVHNYCSAAHQDLCSKVLPIQLSEGSQVDRSKIVSCVQAKGFDMQRRRIIPIDLHEDPKVFLPTTFEKWSQTVTNVPFQQRVLSILANTSEDIVLCCVVDPAMQEIDKFKVIPLLPPGTNSWCSVM